MSLNGLYTITCPVGKCDKNCVLSVTQGGSKVDLYTQDDDSGRQQWLLKCVGKNTYTVSVPKGKSNDRVFLSTTDGKNDDTKNLVDTWKEDDNSGRQKWVFLPVSGKPGVYNIKIAGGRDENLFLSCVEDGSLVDMYSKDDNSGRQQWQLTKCDLSGVYNIECAVGKCDKNCTLSVTQGGSKVDMYSFDDESGRQQWKLSKVGKNTYTVTIPKGKSNDKVYLSTTDGKFDGTKNLVDTYSQDDGSGRQRWVFTPVAGKKDVYNIKIAGGRDENLFLSCVEDGTLVDMYSKDDNSGRQQWQLTKCDLSGVYNIECAVGKCDKNCTLSVTQGGSKVDMYSFDDESGRQQWKLSKVGKNTYTVTIPKGKSNDKVYLSTTDGKFDGTKNLVDTYSQDDGSGRQRWVFIPVAGKKDVYNIKIAGGRDENLFLSCVEDGTLVDMYSKDDNSGRQQWKLSQCVDLSGLYNIVCPVGKCDKNCVLSVTEGGGKVDLYTKDDYSGRQQWKLSKVGKNTYTVTVPKGKSNDKVYLSTTDGNNDDTKNLVDTYSQDDKSGRQRWVFTPVQGLESVYTIRISGGRDSNLFLSCVEDGTLVDMYSGDDKSGRQQWLLKKL